MFNSWDVPKKKDGEKSGPPMPKDLGWRPTWDHNFVADNMLSPNYWKMTKSSHKTRDVVIRMLGLQESSKKDKGNPHKAPIKDKEDFKERKAVLQKDLGQSMATAAAMQSAADGRNKREAAAGRGDKRLPTAWREPMQELRASARIMVHKEMLKVASAVVEEVPPPKPVIEKDLAKQKAAFEEKKRKQEEEKKKPASAKKGAADKGTPSHLICT